MRALYEGEVVLGMCVRTDTWEDSNMEIRAGADCLDHAQSTYYARTYAAYGSWESVAIYLIDENGSIWTFELQRVQEQWL